MHFRMGSFLLRDAVLVRYVLSSCVHMSDRLSGHLSITRRYCVKTVKQRIMQKLLTIAQRL